MPSRARSSRSSGARGGRANASGRAPSRRSSAGPTIAAAAVVLGAVVLAIVVLGGGKDGSGDTRARANAPGTTPAAGPSLPAVPSKLPPPPLPAHLRELAEQLAKDAPVLAKQGEAVYEEANRAKQAGQDDLWQEKLKEASAFFFEIQDRYNELIGDMPSNKDWEDPEELANHYLGDEAEAVRRAMNRLADIRKQRHD